MARPRLSLALSWSDFEKAVHGVFLDALKRLCALARLSVAEPAISLELYWLALAAHQEQFLAGDCLYQFTIDPDSSSKPLPDDYATATRLKKRPDFACSLRDMQASSPVLSQVTYYLECKRLGQQDGDLVFNDLYSGLGIARFMTQEHQYAKGCTSAAMIGFIEDMLPDQVFTEVNNFAIGRAVPSLLKAASGWKAGEVTVLPPALLNRSFDIAQITLHHFWVDLTHCTFDVPSDHPPQSAGNPPPKQGRTNPSQKMGSKKRGGPAAALAVVVKRPPQRIAILGWGSLLWDRDAGFDSLHGKWHTDGPTLKIEYSRISTSRRPGALTLVIDEMNGDPVQVRWCLSKRQLVSAAEKDLRVREDAKVEDIKVLRIDEPHGPFTAGSVEAIIADWATRHELTAVVWTGLPSNFDESYSRFTPAAALDHLKSLPTVRKKKAVEYIKNTLAFVRTAFRTAFESDPVFAE